MLLMLAQSIVSRQGRQSFDHVIFRGTSQPKKLESMALWALRGYKSKWAQIRTSGEVLETSDKPCDSQHSEG